MSHEILAADQLESGSLGTVGCWIGLIGVMRRVRRCSWVGDRDALLLTLKDPLPLCCPVAPFFPFFRGRVPVETQPTKIG